MIKVFESLSLRRTTFETEEEKESVEMMELNE
jgi:hypothetical protein